MCCFACVYYLYNYSGVISLHVIHLPDLTPKLLKGGKQVFDGFFSPPPSPCGTKDSGVAKRMVSIVLVQLGNNNWGGQHNF